MVVLELAIRTGILAMLAIPLGILATLAMRTGILAMLVTTSLVGKSKQLVRGAQLLQLEKVFYKDGLVFGDMFR